MSEWKIECPTGVTYEAPSSACVYRVDKKQLTVICERPMKRTRGSSQKGVKYDLPPRGTGRATGRAGSFRYGQPRTEAERRKRHYNPGRPPKKWFYRCTEAVETKADDPAALCGWIWHKHAKPVTKRIILKEAERRT